MDKEAVYIYTMEYYSAIRRNESESDLGRWMNPEPVKQRVMQKEKNKQLNQKVGQRLKQTFIQRRHING